MIDNKELKKEKDYLKTVLYILNKEIEKSSGKVADLNDDLQDEMKYAWDATNRLSDVEFTYAIADIHRRSYSRNTIADKLKSYRRMIKSAYFARFDFDDGEDVLPVYLGIATLENDECFYVYDWRAPICGMFYDYEMGEASYVTPNGDEIKGKIVLKRQYKIEKDKIIEVFDTNMQIIDDVLRQMLQENTNGKMKNIVSTIQKEQNKVIRKNDVDVLVVSGPAGSGKTSVAMHKIAYILYSLKDKINNSNVLILSPNDIFSNYISNVLPQIGEDNVYQTTFMDYVKTFLTEYKVSGNLTDIYEKIYGKTRDVVYNSIKLKFSTVYLHLIEKYLEQIREEVLGIKDIVVDGKVIIEKNYLKKIANEFDSEGISYLKQYQKIVEKILLHTTIKTQNNKNILAKMRKNLQISKIKPKDLYNRLYSNRDDFVNLIEEIYNIVGTSKQNRFTINELTEIFNYTQSNINKGIMPYEDVSAYLYFKNRLIGSNAQNQIKFVMIDEAQDYSLMQYKIIASIFKNANITLLGDLNQNIMPFASYKNFDSVLNIFAEAREKIRSESMYLSKTYRSTTEINSFAKTVVADSPLYNQIERHGDPVLVKKLTVKDKYMILLKDALNLKNQYKSVAIITKNQAETDEIKKYVIDKKLQGSVKVYSKRDKTFNSDKIMVMPSYLSKGLEFDAVIVSDANDKNYTLEERNLFYVVCTRALHKLNIYYTSKPSELIVNK